MPQRPSRELANKIVPFQQSQTGIRTRRQQHKKAIPGFPQTLHTSVGLSSVCAADSADVQLLALRHYVPRLSRMGLFNEMKGLAPAVRGLPLRLAKWTAFPKVLQSVRISSRCLVCASKKEQRTARTVVTLLLGETVKICYQYGNHVSQAIRNRTKV